MCSAELRLGEQIHEALIECGITLEQVTLVRPSFARPAACWAACGYAVLPACWQLLAASCSRVEFLVHGCVADRLP